MVGLIRLLLLQWLNAFIGFREQRNAGNAITALKIKRRAVEGDRFQTASSGS
jgi:hypothetical protein